MIINVFLIIREIAILQRVITADSRFLHMSASNEPMFNPSTPENLNGDQSGYAAFSFPHLHNVTTYMSMKRFRPISIDEDLDSVQSSRSPVHCDDDDIDRLLLELLQKTHELHLTSTENHNDSKYDPIKRFRSSSNHPPNDNMKLGPHLLGDQT